jgi:hypothetical protein
LDGNDKAGPDLGLWVDTAYFSTIDGRHAVTLTQELQIEKVADAVYGPDSSYTCSAHPLPATWVLKHQQGVRRRCRRSSSCGH